MKILYSIQATGNGHISRAMELLPHLRQLGEIDLFLSGSNSQLKLDAPVKYRSNGLSLFYNCSGGLDYWKMIKGFHPLRLRKEIQELPVEQYDLVINDFEYITAAACARKQVRSVNFGHQASFISDKTPRPARSNRTGEFILKNYSKASHYLGLHFKKYDDFIFTPVIKKDILEAQPSDQGHITIYLPAYCEKELVEVFGQFRDHRFELFSGETRAARMEGNLKILPIDKQLFNQSLIHCHGIICGAGFETPAEALQLRKKLMVIPIRKQYEQQCNAAALAEMGITSLEMIGPDFKEVFEKWLSQPQELQVDYSRTVEECMKHLDLLIR
jgi:uncharacterized protein (TIGR00661 family)